jgi:hypothetical protein
MGSGGKTADGSVSGQQNDCNLGMTGLDLEQEDGELKSGVVEIGPKVLGAGAKIRSD